MKKVIASLLSITLIALNAVSAYAQVPLKGAKGFRAAAKATASASSFSAMRLAAPAVNTAKLSATLSRLNTQALLAQKLTAPQIRQRVQAGHLQDLSARIVNFPQTEERAGLLRAEFVQAALGAPVAPEHLAAALKFWRTDLGKFSQETVQNALADAAALGLFGAQQDETLLTAFYRQASATPAEPAAAAVVSKALLKLKAYDVFTAFIQEVKTPQAVAGAAAHAQEIGVPAAPLAAQPESAPYTLKNAGKITLLAANPSKQAVAEYLALTPKGAQSLAETTKTAPAFRPVPLPDLSLQTPVLSVALSPEITGETLASETAPAGLTAFQLGAKKVLQARRAAAEQKSSVSFLGRTAPASTQGNLYAGVPVPALWKATKKLSAGIKNLFAKKASAPTLSANTNSSTFVQRASLYMSSFVVGLEVATPVIANFGTSFGLSLEDNILVAVATYLPYSVGSFLSNWLKEKIGRKASLNVGLGLLGAGFTAGVSLLGLNGNFVPWQDAMAHFYSILGCIMAASTGGVFVHNAIGPMMTEISANESELIRQKRSANTELGRAMGMAASFAFPFIATKLMGMDWSFTFAMPLPLVAAAALGLNLSKIPNSKPQVSAPEVKTGEKAGKFAALKNNAYVRLFKEEKGVAALLTGLFAMNAVETCFSNGFLFLLPGLTEDPSAQYLFGLAQFAAPFLLGRYLAGNFLKWFPKHNMSIATLLSAVGGVAALPLANDAYTLTAALFAAEVGISTAFTLAFARTAKNTHTQDRVISLIVASAVSCALGPMLFSNLAQNLMDAGIFSSADATTAALIGVPSVLAFLSAGLFHKLEKNQAKAAAQPAGEKSSSPNWLKKIANYFSGKKK